ncbi:hypothetical protein NSP_36810 [Nodularia spumigena CCY9414]|nr:hypothetical protein NSP_36810 [Nodularia spumigena CCY9414]
MILPIDLLVFAKIQRNLKSQTHSDCTCLTKFPSGFQPMSTS